jgi:hypothetical protein
MISLSDVDLACPEAPSSQPSSRIEADDSLDDEGYAESTSTSYVTSIAIDIRRGIEGNGRLYANYGQHKPWVPVDNAEMRQSPILEGAAIVDYWHI